MNKYKITVTDAHHGKRIDEVLMHHLAHLSNRRVRSIIDIGGVYINRKRVRFRSREVAIGDYIEVEYNPQAMQKMNRQQFVLTEADILYHEHGLLAINKPPGLPSQSTRDQAVVHVVPVVENYFRSRKEKVPKLTLLHRLDKETSGVLLLATDHKIAEKVSADFKERRIAKQYHAVTWGIPRPVFKVECYLSDIDKKSGLVRRVQSGGRTSLTNFRLLTQNKSLQVALLLCEPHTGRSHQIRVHLELEGTPIMGDKRYGGEKRLSLPDNLAKLTSEYHFLHAYSLQLRLPGVKHEISIEAPYPKNMQQFIAQAKLELFTTQH